MRNIERNVDKLAELRSRLASLDRPGPGRNSFRQVQDQNAFPSVWESGLIHDLYAETVADAVAVNAFGLGLMVQAARGRTIVWALHDMAGREAGRPHGVGLHEMGLTPAEVLLVWARDVQTLLAIGEEALRSPAVGAVLLSAWGEAKAMSLTASRRLALAAEAGNGTLFISRAGASPSPSAADSRWSVRATQSTSLEEGAPGHPSFSVTLLRRRGGGAPKNWMVEWDRDIRSFRSTPPVSGALVPLVAQRTAQSAGSDRRRVA